MGSFSYFKSTEYKKTIGKSFRRVGHREIRLVRMNIWGEMGDEVGHFLKVQFILQDGSPRRDQVGDSGITCCLDSPGFSPLLWHRLQQRAKQGHRI